MRLSDLYSLTQDQLATRVVSYLTGKTGLSTHPDVVCKTVSMLNEEGLRQFDLGFYYVNLLSVLGSQFSSHAIKELAIQAARQRILSNWHSARYNACISGGPLTVALNGWNYEYIERALAQGRGLIVCTAHYGNYRLIPTDLSAFGLTVQMAMDSMSTSCWAQLLDLADQNSSRDSRGKLILCDVERDRSAPILLRRALANNQIVLFWADGNLGLDGRLGSSNRVRVNFLNHTIEVKSGIPHLSRISGAPILTVFVSDGLGGQGRVEYSRLTYCTDDNQTAPDDAAALWMQQFYKELERLVLQHPEQWESIRFLHRWRFQANETPGPDKRAESQRIEEFTTRLNNRMCLKLNDRRVVSFTSSSAMTFLDTDTLKAYQIGKIPDPIFFLLSHDGLSRDALEAWDKEHEGRGISQIMASLYGRGLLDIVPTVADGQSIKKGGEPHDT